MSRTTEPLTEPTSERIAPGFRCGPISLATAPLAPTGIETMTRSASFTACALVSVDLIRETEFGDALARFRRARGGDNGLGGAGRARGARDRAADQAGADQRKAFDNGFGFCHASAHLPMNSASVFTAGDWPLPIRPSCASAFGR